MRYTLESGKTVTIPNDDIERSMKMLKISKDEAIKVWLEDEGYLINEEQEALTKKAKENRITATIHEARTYTKKTQKERVRKENPTKAMVIAEIAAILPKFAENIQILNENKLISFTIGEDTFEIDLRQKRKPKN